MHSTPSTTPFSVRALACALLLLIGSAAQAQVPADPSAAQPASAPVSGKHPIEQTRQHIVVEDKANRIDEERVGSETKSIDVQPKNGMPAYKVEPKTGERTWKVLGF